MSKITWVKDDVHFHGCPWCGDPDEVHIEGECPSEQEREDLAGIFTEDITDEEIAASLVDVDPIVQIPPVNEYVQKVRITDVRKAQLIGLYVDRTMVGKTLWLTAVNKTGKMWPAGRCYPSCYWIRRNKRMDGPMTKDQPFMIDVQLGGTVPFGVVVPRFPTEKPDFLRVAVLENGVGWYKVEDLRVR